MNKIKVDWTELQYDIFIIKCLSIFFIFLAVSIVTKHQSSLLFFFLFFFFEQILMTADNESH